MKLLHIKDGHPRNVEFIRRACILFNIEYHHTYESYPSDNGYDIIWAPMEWIDPDRYPHSKIIFGPHFWVFPDNNDPLYTRAKPEHAKRCIYLCLSDWNIHVFNEFLAIQPPIIPHVALPFGVLNSVQGISTTKSSYDYDCIIYFKARHPTYLDFCMKIVEERGLKYRLFRYGTYSRDEYMAALQRTRFVIWIGSHESQGFGLEECLTSNTPIYLYDAPSMKCEYINGSYSFAHYPQQLRATSAPYWNNECGMKVHTHDEFIQRLPEFIERLPTYNPAAYVERMLTDRVCFQRFLDVLRVEHL